MHSLLMWRYLLVFEVPGTSEVAAVVARGRFVRVQRRVLGQDLVAVVVSTVLGHVAK
ncbi:hypothetical protein D3C75_1387310 [compost metagenome]